MKTTLLFSIILAGLAAAGCSHTTRSSTEVARSGTPDGFQNPPAADPTVAADPTKPNSPANSVLVPQNPPPAANEPQTSPANTDQVSNVSATSPAAPSAATAATSTTPNAADATKSTTDTASATASTATPNASYSGAKSDDNLNSTDAKAHTSISATTSAIPSAPPVANSASTDITTAVSSRSADDIAAASTSSADLSTRITELRLGATEIQSDLDGGATIVRSKESVVGAPTGKSDDAVIITSVKEKLHADADLGQAMIDVEASNGEVTLKGTADNAAQIGRAIALALDSQGVTKVSADIKVSAAANK